MEAGYNVKRWRGVPTILTPKAPPVNEFAI